MSTAEPSDPQLSRELLRALAAEQGMEVEEEDLDAVIAFLRVLLPQLRALEEMVSPDTVPAGLFLPTKQR